MVYHRNNAFARCFSTQSGFSRRILAQGARGRAPGELLANSYNFGRYDPAASSTIVPAMAAARATGPGDTAGASEGAPTRALVILEQTLGHVTHGDNLMNVLPTVPGCAPMFLLVPFDVTGWRSRVPGFRNWTIRAGLRARRQVHAALKGGMRPDVLFVHTQVPAILMGRAPVGVPLVVSLDATPIQYDSLGEHYAHEVGPAASERLKFTLNRRCFRGARHIVAWSQWTRSSLIHDYGIDPDGVTVIPPGVDTARWSAKRTRAGGPGADPNDDTVRILFVGGDLDRKGGRHLLAAFAAIRGELGDRVELHLVTRSPVEPRTGVHVHSMAPNSEELIGLYHRCDIFCLPTFGDCLPMVLAEAGAAGLAPVTTDVGAISEIVRDGTTGLLVPVGDTEALVVALRRLVQDPALRARLASAANRLVLDEHDATVNAARLAAVLRVAADGSRSRVRSEQG